MGLNGNNKRLNNTKRPQLHDIMKWLKVNQLHKQRDLFYTDANIDEVWHNEKVVQLKMSSKKTNKLASVVFFADELSPIVMAFVTACSEVGSGAHIHHLRKTVG